jgi:ATP-dependent DNA helicase DinG
MTTLATVFSADGPLARHLPGFSHRDAQADMAGLIWEALSDGHHLAVEAGTGIGKTFAYLVPVLLAGRRAVISTGTKTLQDQLYGRDLPALGAAIGRPLTVALLKGRGNYLCWHRLELAQRGDLGHVAWSGGLGAVERWARASASGDLTEHSDLGDDRALTSWITSTVDNCLGVKCEWIDDCFVVKARRQAQAADVVVVNHHLLLADLALKESGFGELLPGAEVVIVDEAHLLPDIAQQFFGIAASTRELTTLSRDLVAEARSAGLAAELEPLVDAVGRAASESRAVAGGASGRMPWRAAAPPLRDSVAAWSQPLAALVSALGGVRDAAAGLGRAYERCVDIAARLDTLATDDARGLRWLEVSDRNLTLHWTPLDTGVELGERIAAHGGTWVFASATLAVGDDFSHFLGRVGTPDARTAVLPSPFDYRRHARLYLPEGLPAPAEPDFVQSLLGSVWPLIDAAGGGAFLLFTSYRALDDAHRWLESRELPGPLFIQGQGARTDLLERFRESGNGVLLGTSSFWQGVDVKGDALRIVVIDKLPFASPGDPLLRARLDAIREQGSDPFNAFQLPQAVLTLKQGVGRLIRDFDDRGLIVIGDPRLRTRAYGRVFVASLPPMPLLETPEQALDFAASLRPAMVEPHVPEREPGERSESAP